LESLGEHHRPLSVGIDEKQGAGKYRVTSCFGWIHRRLLRSLFSQEA
jgi:hypothetical protein